MNTNEAIWPGWETVRMIGRGSFGAVYEIQRQVRGRTEHAALKVISIPKDEGEIQSLRTGGYDNESITSYFADGRDQIEDEYAVMADMKGHANIVYCDDIRTIQHDDGFGWDIFIKMELLTPMKKFFSGEVSEEQVIRVGIDICSALVACQSRNIVHRDIKPDNIFVSWDGSYKLGDFGIARSMENTTMGTFTGTYEYMAPEIYNHLPYNSSADIYSLGLVMYWLMNNRTAPFLPQSANMPTPSAMSEARNRRFSGENIPAPQHGSKELWKVVLKACAYDVKKRYISAAEMKKDLETLLYGKKQLSKINAKSVADRSDRNAIDDEKTIYIRDENSADSGKSLAKHKAGKFVRKKNVQKRKKSLKWIFWVSGVLALVGLCTVLLLCRNQGKAGEHVRWALEDGTLTISGSGPMKNYNISSEAPWCKSDRRRKTIQAVKVEEGVTSIGDDAFKYCEELTDITIADSVTEIGGGAFWCCTGLTDIRLPANLETIGFGAFYGCNGLSNLEIPLCVTQIRSSAFEHTGVKDITLSGDCRFACDSFPEVANIRINDTNLNDGVCGENIRWVLDESGVLKILGTGEVFASTVVSDEAAPWFPRRQDITAVSISEGITGIGANAFYGCVNLTDVSLPDSVSSIGAGAFSNCSSLTSILLPEALKRIRSFAFRNCINLKAVEIPDNIESIDSSAFYECKNLVSVTIQKDKANILTKAVNPQKVEIKYKS